jgi:hypothetical protein
LSVTIAMAPCREVSTRLDINSSDCRDQPPAK